MWVDSRGVIVSIKFESTLDAQATAIQLNAANVLFAIAVAYSSHGYLDLGRAHIA